MISPLEVVSMSEDRSRQFRMAGIKSLILFYILLSVQIVVFFFSAGHIPGIRSWIYFFTAFIHSTASTVVQWKLNPELLIERLKPKRKGSKLWDEVLMRICNLTILLVVPIVAGLDIGNYYWSNLDIVLIPLGLFLVLISSILLNWAMVVNPHFEPTVRIQKDRAHRVITSGPYKIVRHPGYLAGILYALAIPFLIGSTFTFLPVGIYCLLMMTRTHLEDETLQKELTGYLEYTQKTRYRLFPGIW